MGQKCVNVCKDVALELIKTHGEVTTKMILETLPHYNHTYIGILLKRMTETGLLERQPRKDKTGMYYVYTLPTQIVESVEVVDVPVVDVKPVETHNFTEQIISVEKMLETMREVFRENKELYAENLEMKHRINELEMKLSTLEKPKRLFGLL